MAPAQPGRLLRGARNRWERLRWRVWPGMSGRRRVVRARGLRFTLQCDNWITHYRWRTYNSKEPDTLDWIDGAMQGGGILFDVGANIGVYSIYAALRHRGMRVIAFEPEYANLHLLRDNLLENGLQGRVDVYAIALSNATGLSWLHVQDLTPGAALHTESPQALRLTLTQKPVVWREGVSAWTLDRFCEEAHLAPDFLKIDVDGSEPRVLEGAAKTLNAASLRSVLIEWPHDPLAAKRCEQLLREAGLTRQGRRAAAGSPNEIWSRAATPRVERTQDTCASNR